MSNLEANIKITLNSSSVSGVIEKLAELLAEKNGQKQKKWIDSKAAMELLGVSKNTLQKLRDNKVIRVSRPPEIGKLE
jgi:hypothetical protein